MSIKCGFCKGTKVEPGFTECVWCDSTGLEGGLQPTDIKRACAEIKAVREHQGATEVKRYHVQLFKLAGDQQKYAHGALGAVEIVRASDFDRITAERDALQQRLNLADQLADGFEGRIARLRHVGMELTGVIDEYRAMPCDSLKVRMFQTADRYRKRLTAKCGNCEDHGVIGYTTGQTPETFDQGEYPCPECHPAEYAAWRKP